MEIEDINILYERCKKSPYYFATNFINIKIEGKIKPFKTKLSEKEFNKMFKNYHIFKKLTQINN